jgi:FKBP-type peptidyl-prolyl cis-trans isomerase SlyD
MKICRDAVASSDSTLTNGAVTVVELGDGEVTLDGNHPLAGETLHFAVSVVDVRAATAEELSHGHVHGPGGPAH